MGKGRKKTISESEKARRAKSLDIARLKRWPKNIEAQLPSNEKPASSDTQSE